MGTKLIENSQDIALTVASLKWYNHAPAVRKSLLLIMLRAQRPVSVTAGKFYSVSLESFTAVMGLSNCILQVITHSLLFCRSSVHPYPISPC